MPEINHPNLGDVVKTRFLNGTILSVDSSDDTASVRVTLPDLSTVICNDVPIFYHCVPDAEERSNGAIEGAAGGFSVDDEVILFARDNIATAKNLRVIGHEEGIESCSPEGLYAYVLISGSRIISHSIYNLDVNIYFINTEETSLPSRDEIAFSLEDGVDIKTLSNWNDPVWGWAADPLLDTYILAMKAQLSGGICYKSGKKYNAIAERKSFQLEYISGWLNNYYYENFINASLVAKSLDGNASLSLCGQTIPIFCLCVYDLYQAVLGTMDETSTAILGSSQQTLLYHESLTYYGGFLDETNDPGNVTPICSGETEFDYS